MSDDALSDDLNSTRGVTLQELLRRSVQGALAEAAIGCLPARVESYDASKQQVNVQILVYDFHRDETGALVPAPVPVINSIPVQFPAGGGYVLTFPIAVGDTGAIMFAARSLDRWLASSGDPVDPELYHRFAPTDAVYLPGVYPFGAPRTSAPTDHAILGKDGGVQIHCEASTITIGDTSGSKAIALNGDACAIAAALATWMGNVQTSLNTLGQPVAALVGTTIANVSASATQAKAK